MEFTKEQLKEEFKRDYYQPDYLSIFNIGKKKRKADISAIIPTYNRCPFSKKSPNYEYNPLAVCIRALLMQESPIQEIIVVDDASIDNTKQVVEELAQEAYAKKGIMVRYFYNAERKGSSFSRNIGAKNASSKYLFFLDDDCVPTPYLSFVSMIVIKKLEKADGNFALLVLPVYDRASFPKKAVSVPDLTLSFFKREDKSASFNSVPIEYLKAKGRFLNRNLKIFKPIEVYQTWGHFIIDRSKYLDVGGFPDFATWPNRAGEEQEFACRLIENAYSLYYLPETKASSYHGAYGAKLGEFEGGDWLANMTGGKLSLVKFSKICDDGIMSGNRVSVEDYLYSKIIATFCIIYKRNTKEAINWARRSYQDFVAGNEKSWYPLYARKLIGWREKREGIWHRAINDGLFLLFEVEQKRLTRLDRFIESLKTRGKLDEETKNGFHKNQPKVFSAIKKSVFHSTRPQEDYFGISKEYPIFVVADGVTLQTSKGTSYPSQSGAAKAAEIFCEAVIREAEKRYEKFDEQSLREVFEAGNKAVCDYNVSMGVTKDKINYFDIDLFSATASFLLLKDKKAFWFSLCDAGFIAFNSNGSKIFQSPDGWINFPKNWVEGKDDVEKIVTRHRDYRNKVKDGKLMGYGVADGEDSAVSYLYTGVLEISDNDILFLYTDGFENYFALEKFVDIFRNWSISEFEPFSRARERKNPKKYGKERTLIAIKRD